MSPSLAWPLNERLARLIAALMQPPVEPLKQPCQRAAAGQLFAEQPDRFGVRHRVVQRQADEAHEREPVAQLILGLLVRQRVAVWPPAASSTSPVSEAPGSIYRTNF